METLDLLNALYRDCLTSDPRATANFSIVEGPLVPEGIRPIPVLLHGRCPLVRSRLRSRLLRRLDLELGALNADDEPQRLPLVGMGGVVFDDRVVLVPADPLASSGVVERTVRDANAHLLEPVGHGLDPRRGTVEVARGLAGQQVVIQDDLAPAAHTLHVGGILLADRPGGTPLTAGGALASFLQHVRLPAGEQRREALRSLALMHPSLSLTTVAHQDGNAAARALRTLGVDLPS